MTWEFIKDVIDNKKTIIRKCNSSDFLDHTYYEFKNNKWYLNGNKGLKYSPSHVASVVHDLFYYNDWQIAQEKEKS